MYVLPYVTSVRLSSWIIIIIIIIIISCDTHKIKVVPQYSGLNIDTQHNKHRTLH